MEREASLLIISLVVCAPLWLVAGALAQPIRRLARSGHLAERAAWRRLWIPLLPACLALMVLVGWAVQEPDPTDEQLDPRLLAVAFLTAVIAARAIARAIQATRIRVTLPAATVGLLRPRVAIDDALSSMLDEDELAAVRVHERAHARHYDPLRIWLGQLAADLQWPAPSAAIRFRQWLHALELARDEEAREAGIYGAALAAAVVTVARLGTTRCGPVAGLVSSGELLRDRIVRLLEPLVDSQRASGLRWRVAILAVLVAAVGIGVFAGDTILHWIPGISTCA